MKLIKMNNQPSVNALAQPLVQALIANAAALRLAVDTLTNGTVVVDAGIAVLGGIEAGRRIAEICLGGLGRVSIRAGGDFSHSPWQLDVYTSNPVLACLASQYAGWSLEYGEGKSAFNALGSGPARAIGSHEPLFQELGYRDAFDKACLVLEVKDRPPVEIAEKVANSCAIKPQDLTFILTPTTSLCGAVQVVARSLEVSLHRVHTLGFPLSAIVDGMATAPICPPSNDFIVAMGRTNDAIMYGGYVKLYVDCGDSDAEDLARKLPSSSSRDYGKPFAEIFKNYKYNFYAIDPGLFSPARITICSVRTGKAYHGGKFNEALLDRSFS
ncbi:MAG: methenyltetrahydromethanopterin cyclohydrolase [Chromatiales bacterium]